MHRAKQWQKKIVLVGLLSGALLASLFPVAPVVAGGISKTVRGEGHITRGGETFEIEVFAVDAPGNDFLFVTVKDRRNPDGPTDITQSFQKSFRLSPDAVHIENDLTNGSVKDLSLPGDNGAVNFRFRRDGDLHDACGGDTKRRAVELFEPQDNGRFRIKTGNRVLDTLTNLPNKGRAERGPEEACSSGSAGQCAPRRGLSVNGNAGQGRSLFVFAQKENGASRATVFMDVTFPSGADGKVNRFVSLRGTVGADRLSVDAGLDDGALNGGFPWTDGDVKLRREGGVSRGEWFNCNAESQNRGSDANAIVRQVTDLKIHIIGEDDVSVKDSHDGFLSKYERRPRD